MHKSEYDDDFGSLNNCDDANININSAEHNFALQTDPYADYMTPYERYLYICRHAAPLSQPPKPAKVSKKTPQITNISNFKATPAEIKRAQELAQDRQMKPINLEHLKKRSMWLYNQMCDLCYNQYPDVWAKHTFHVKKIHGYEFTIDLREASVGMKIFQKPYHLDEDRRLVCIYHTMKNIENGILSSLATLHIMCQ